MREMRISERFWFVQKRPSPETKNHEKVKSLKTCARGSASRRPRLVGIYEGIWVGMREMGGYGRAGRLRERKVAGLELGKDLIRQSY